MTSSEVWDEETAARYDADVAAQFEPAVLDPTVDALTRMAADGPALELAIGTGRVAIPLAARGVRVTGIELSAAMLAQLRRKVGEDRIPVLLGDMATSVVPGAGEFSLVFLVFNSISNLRTQDEQVECFRNAARHLRPGGRFVIDLWVPPIQRLAPGERTVAMDVGEGHASFDTYDLLTQSCTSHHYVRDDDGTVHYGAGRFRYIWPAECDLMARLIAKARADRGAKPAIEAVRCSVPRLIDLQRDSLAMPTKVGLRRATIEKRTAAIGRALAEVWTPETAARKTAEIVHYVQSVVDDDSYRANSTSRFRVTDWQGIAVYGSTATAILTGVSDYLVPGEGWNSEQEAQYQVTLRRNGPSEDWQIDRMIELILEGQD